MEHPQTLLLLNSALDCQKEVINELSQLDFEANVQTLHLAPLVIVLQTAAEYTANNIRVIKHRIEDM